MEVGVARHSQPLKHFEAQASRPVVVIAESILHRRGLDQLEAEMMAFSREWDRAVDGSPNRLDAAVWRQTPFPSDRSCPGNAACPLLACAVRRRRFPVAATPPGKRSSRKQSEQLWRKRSG